eukprot:8113823-Alexandrium_andersonii.AAC.1
MLRINTRTPSTYASKVLGVGTIITHRQLREKLGVFSLEDALRFRRLWLLRGGAHPGYGGPRADDLLRPLRGAPHPGWPPEGWRPPGQ